MPKLRKNTSTSGLLLLIVIVALALIGVMIGLVGQFIAGDENSATSHDYSWYSGSAQTQELSQESDSATQAARVDSPTTFDIDAWPNYYRIVGPAVVDEDIAPGTVRYAGLDKLGRTRAVVASVDYEMMLKGSERERSGMADIHPSGWGHNKKVKIRYSNGKSYSGYMYNRSHMLAKSLGGADSLENMLTGTRTQNVGEDDQGGMAFTETLAREWLKAHQTGYIFYKVTPLYSDTELLARSVIVDIQSSDKAIDMEVEVFNAARGYSIDYKTGEFQASI